MSSSADSIAPHERSTLEAEQRTSYLETRLREVTTDANALATEFMSLREQLSNENAYLSNRIAELGNVRDDRTREIAHLAQENLRIAAQNEDMVRRLKEVGQLVQVMGGQRGKLMGKVEEWEDGLMVAGREGWRAPATPRVVENKKGFGFQDTVEQAESKDGSSSVGMGSLVSGASSAEEAEEEKDGAPPAISASDSGEAVFGGAASF